VPTGGPWLPVIETGRVATAWPGWAGPGRGREGGGEQAGGKNWASGPKWKGGKREKENSLFIF
jgi:hypothetical protein